jgi:hypothetical protein
MKKFMFIPVILVTALLNMLVAYIANKVLGISTYEAFDGLTAIEIIAYFFFV